ncbi:MAG: hypothetical protein WBO17_05835 [Sphingorhabdus sp.]
MNIARALKAGTAYWVMIFSLGFVLGMLRVMIVLPWLGNELGAVLLELPVILAASWVAARLLVRRFQLNRSSEMWLMGCLAFALTLMSEALLAVFVFKEFLHEWAASQLVLPGALGFAGQMMFAAIPWLIHRKDRARRD